MSLLCSACASLALSVSKRLIKRSAEVATTWLSLSLTLTRLYALVIRSAVIAYPSFWLPPSLVRLSDFLNLAQNLRPVDSPNAWAKLVSRDSFFMDYTPEPGWLHLRSFGGFVYRYQLLFGAH